MKQKYFLKIAFCFLLISNFSYGQILNETFDDDSKFNKSESFFTDGGSDYFGILDPVDGNSNDFDSNPNDNTPTGLSSFTGNVGNYLRGEDLDGEGGSKTQILTWTGLNINGFTNLNFSVKLGASNGFDNNSSGQDEITLAVNIDGGGYTDISKFVVASGSSQFPTDGTTTLGLAMQNISGNILESGAIMDVRLTLRADSGGEEFAVDDLQINGTASTTPTIGFGEATSTENETDATFSVDVPVTVSNHDGNQIDMSVAVTGGTAEVADYTLNTTSLSFTGDGTQNVSIDIVPDTEDFDDETIILTLTETSSVTGLVISESTHTITVSDDETAPSIGFGSATSTENETNVTFTSTNIPISVSDYSGTQIDVNVSVTGGTAEAEDYTFTSPTSLSFTADGTQNITVDINDDADTDDETIIFTITETSSVTGLIISQATHTLTIDDDEVPLVPTAGTVFITEVSDAASSSNEFIELFNNNNFSVDLSTSKLVMLNDDLVVDFDGTDLPTATIPANGFLILTRGSDKTTFEGVFGTLNTNTTFIQGKSSFYFGTSTARRWQLKTGGSNNTDDGTLIDDTETAVGGNNRHYQNIFTDTYISTSESDANPGELEYLVFNGGAWVNAIAMDASTGTKDVYFYDDYTISANAEVNTIGINTGKTVTANSAAQITVNGDLKVNGSFTINSGVSLIVNGSSTGNITYTRTLDTDNWYLITIPVAGQSYGNFLANSNLATGTGNNIGLATYSNVTEEWNYFQSNNSLLGSFDPGRGYAIKLSASGNINFTGTFNDTDVNLNMLSRNTNGFILIGNPYLAAVSVEELLNENADILEERTIWLWDQAQDSYVQKNLAEDLEIAPGQGFFISVKTGNWSFDFREGMQSHIVDTFQKGGSNRTRVQLQMTDGTANSSTNLVYLDGVTTGWDNGYDSSIFEGVENSFQVYTQAVANSNGRKLGIQSLPDNNYEEMIVPIGIKATAGKALTFAVNASNLPEGLMVFLEDRLNDTRVRLDEAGSSYAVTLDSNQNGVGRFYIHTSQNALSIDNVALNSVSIFKATATTLRVTGLQQGKASLSLFNVLGKQVMNTSFEATASKDIYLPKLAKGIYFAQVQTAAGKLSKQIIIE
jgi:hypothetical protein